MENGIMEALFCALGVFVGNLIFHPLILKKSWKEAFVIGVLSGVLFFVLMMVFGNGADASVNSSVIVPTRF